MSRIEKYRCDHCGKEVEDRYAVKGWLSFDTEHTRCYISNARCAGRHTMTDSFILAQDYCSIKCLMDRINKELAELDGKKAK